ncbi:hypothetical protein Tco_1102754 [Tanacetum coccineum]
MELEKKVKQLAQAVYSFMTNDSKSINQVKTVAMKSSSDTHCSTSLDSNTNLCTFVVSNLIEQENVMKTCESNETPRPSFVIGTFALKVKRRIAKEQEKTFLESLERVSVNTPLIDVLRQTLNYTKSMQELVSKKTRIEEVSMVKLNARLDFVILDIVEDEKVSILLGTPIFATTHVRIDVFGKKILLVAGGEKENLEEFLMNDEINGDLGDFLEFDDLFLENGVEPFGIPLDLESKMEIRLEDFSGKLEDLLDEQAP